MIQVMSYAIDRLCGPKDSFVLKVALSKCDINKPWNFQPLITKNKWRPRLSSRHWTSSMSLLQLEQELASLLHHLINNNQEGETYCWKQRWLFLRFWTWRKLLSLRRVRWKWDRSYHLLSLTLPSSSSKPNLLILLLSAQVMLIPTLILRVLALLINLWHSSRNGFSLFKVLPRLGRLVYIQLGSIFWVISDNMDKILDNLDFSG